MKKIMDKQQKKLKKNKKNKKLKINEIQQDHGNTNYSIGNESSLIELKKDASISICFDD